jgi:hypothetical protein
MKNLIVLSTLLVGCGTEPQVASEQPLGVTIVHLSKTTAPEIEVIAESRGERAQHLASTARADSIVALGGGANGAGAPGSGGACSWYAQQVLLELCDNASPGCATGNLACIYGTPQDGLLPLTSVPRGSGAILGPPPPQKTFYQNVVQYRPNQLGADFEWRRATPPYFTYCTETSIDDPWWIRAGSCAAHNANMVGINCIGAASQLKCTYDSDCCGVGAWCNAGTCVGGTY